MAQGSNPRERRTTRRCRGCGQRFSSDASFCAFDGGPLAAESDWAPAGDPLLGSVLHERYECEALIGEGGTASVYRVQDLWLGRPFAMKVLRRELSRDAELRQRFVSEARTTDGVSHPGLVCVTDSGGLPDGRPFFVMNLLEGQTLRALLRRGRLPAARAAGIARGIAEAMAAAHEAGIVHRDLKPENVHLGHRDHVTIVDFGFAVSSGGDSGRVARSTLAFGTPQYMSPEQTQGDAVDARSDVYALGIVLYEMLTGHVPFDADSSADVLALHQSELPLPPSRLLGSEPTLERLERVVLVCLKKRAEDRFASLRLVSAALAVAMQPDAARVGQRPDGS
jgi:serine/threonine-protein kinase